MANICAHVWISGKVQGVGYRYSTQDMAMMLGVVGWVRNLPDGRVEAIFEGTQQKIQEIIRWCHQGPPGAIVRDVMVVYEPLEGLKKFEIRR